MHAADHEPDQRSTGSAMIVVVDQRADDGEQHADRRLLHAALALVRAGQALQAEDEEDRRGQVARLDDEVSRIVTSGRFRGRRRPRRCPRRALRLNIFSMRSVMRKPPTTLVVAQTTAMKPRIVATCRACRRRRPASRRARSPEIALVADISGVCSSGGTRVITRKPTNAGQHEHVELQDDREVHVVLTGARLPSWVTTIAPVISSVRSSVSGSSFDQVLQQRRACCG